MTGPDGRTDPPERSALRREPGTASRAVRPPGPHSPEVLVIGASGKTGRAVTRALVDRGVRVRAAVRPSSTFTPPRPYAAGPAPDARADLVRPVAVDLESGLGLEVAVAGADAVYHLAPNVHPDEVGIAARVGATARSAGVDRFVFHSVLHPRDASMAHHVRKGQAEELLRAHLPATTVLRPAAYLQNLLDAALAGTMTVPYRLDAPFTNVDLDDVAEVAARVLTEPGHEGADYDLVGPESLTVAESAAIATTVLGRPVTARATTVEEWIVGPGAALPPGPRADLVAMFRAYDREGLVDTSEDLSRLLGRPGHTWRDVLLRNV